MDREQVQSSFNSFEVSREGMPRCALRAYIHTYSKLGLELTDADLIEPIQGLRRAGRCALETGDAVSGTQPADSSASTEVAGLLLKGSLAGEPTEGCRRWHEAVGVKRKATMRLYSTVPM